MILPLALGIVDAVQAPKEQRRGIAVDQRNVVVVAEQGDDLPGLVLPQQAVVDEDAGQLLADRLVDQHRRHRGVDPAGEPADHLAVADLLLIRATARSRNAAMVQVPSRPTTLRQKLARSLPPSGVCATSGWNIRP